MTGRSMIWNRRTQTALAAAALLALAATLSCKVKLSPESVVNTFQAVQDARKELTPENEYYVGRAVATNLLARHEYRYLDREALSEGELRGVTAYVNRVGHVVAAAAMGMPREDDRPAPISGWHFVVIEHDDINAFAAPGGWVFVTTAAVSAARNEDQLAAILAHEVAHVVRGHALGSIKKSRWAGVAKTALDSSVELNERVLGDLTKAFEGAMDDMIDATLVKGYSRKTEIEADLVGIEVMAHAGYDPGAFVAYLKTLDKKQETGSGGLFTTHPKAGDRIQNLSQKVAELGRRKLSKRRTARFRKATVSLRGISRRTSGNE